LDLSQRSELTQSVNHSSGSYELVLGAVIFGLIGFMVDRMVDTTPVFTIIFAVVGLAGATASIYFRYTHKMRQLAEQRP
jgi:F0F1-type ATP synthase assembly protein I